MKTNLLLFSSMLFLINCSSTETVECVDCSKAPTALLLPDTQGTIEPDNQHKKEQSKKSETVIVVPIIDLNKNIKSESSEIEIEVEKKTIPTTDNTITKSLDTLALKAKDKWSADGYIQPSKHRYVKYLDDYTTRVDIQFDSGKITVSTISSEEPKHKLRDAIVQVLLMPQAPKSIDLFGSKEIPLEKQKDALLFLGQVLDQDTKPIESEWHATRFADYLIENKLQQKPYSGKAANFVEIKMVENHLDLREKIYAKSIQTTAKKYDLSEELISSVIIAESSFNPFSVSHAGALGLMQIVPKTAGADVFKLVKKTEELPSTEYLFNPQNNIDVGSAYLNILYNRYLGALTDPISKYFAMIAAYNSGAKGVLSTFDLDKQKAIDIINQNEPRQVYDLLITQHPREEARTYLQKVLGLQKSFNLNDV